MVEHGSPKPGTGVRSPPPLQIYMRRKTMDIGKIPAGRVFVVTSDGLYFGRMMLVRNDKIYVFVEKINENFDLFLEGSVVLFSGELVLGTIIGKSQKRSVVEGAVIHRVVACSG